MAANKRHIHRAGTQRIEGLKELSLVCDFGFGNTGCDVVYVSLKVVEELLFDPKRNDAESAVRWDLTQNLPIETTQNRTQLKNIVIPQPNLCIDLYSFVSKGRIRVRDCHRWSYCDSLGSSKAETGSICIGTPQWSHTQFDSTKIPKALQHREVKNHV